MKLIINFLALILVTALCLSTAPPAAASPAVQKIAITPADGTTTGVIYLKSSASHVATDTITNAITEYQVADVGFAKHKLSIQSTVTKISGTVAGVMRLEASNDGVNYVRVNPTDSLTLTNVASQTHIFTVTVNLYKYYRIKISPTGTQSAKLNSLCLWRQEE